MANAREIILGNKVKDIVTGFTGIAVQRLEDLDGTIKMGVQAMHAKTDAKLPPIEWIGIERLDLVEGGISVSKSDRQIGFRNE